MKTKSPFLVALHLLLVGGLLLACAVFAHAERGADHQPLVGEGVRELLTENLEKESFLGDGLNIGLFLPIFCGGLLSDKQTFTLCVCSVVDRFAAPFSGWITPLRI